MYMCTCTMYTLLYVLYVVCVRTLYMHMTLDIPPSCAYKTVILHCQALCYSHFIMHSVHMVGFKWWFNTVLSTCMLSTCMLSTCTYVHCIHE